MNVAAVEKSGLGIRQRFQTHFKSLQDDASGILSGKMLMMWCLYLTFVGTKMALKFVTKNKTKLKSFLREYSLTGSLSCSPFIIKVVDVLFETEDSYVFGQEYAPAGDLFDIIPPQVTLLSFLPPITILIRPELLQSVAMFIHGSFNKLSWDWSLPLLLVFSHFVLALFQMICWKCLTSRFFKRLIKMVAAEVKPEIFVSVFLFYIKMASSSFQQYCNIVYCNIL